MSSSPKEDVSGNRLSSSRLEQAAASDASITAIHIQLLREKPEPTEGFSPIPIFMLFVFSALVFIGGIYLGTKSGHFSPLAFDPTRDYGTAVAEAPKGPNMAVLGARRYNQICVQCHQPNGMGQPNAFPPLAGSEYVVGQEDRLILIVRHGLTGPIEVAGQNFNGAMPSQFGAGLLRNETDIAAVLTHIRSQWGNNAPPVTPEKVAEVLAAVGARTTPWTVPELDAYK